MIQVTVIETGSIGNCYLLKFSNGKILIIECGVAYHKLQKALNFDFSNVIGCLITHEHKDHSRSVKELIKNGIKVYASKGTFNALKIKENYYTKIISNTRMFNIFDITIFPFETFHDCTEPLGYVIIYKKQKLLFATDTGYIKHAFKNLDYMLIECNYDLETTLYNDEIMANHYKKTDRVLDTHMELETCKNYIKISENDDLKNVLLIHPSTENLNREKAIKELSTVTKAKIEIAYKGCEYVLQKKKRK